MTLRRRVSPRSKTPGGQEGTLSGMDKLIALVTGASRGIGRGVAHELGLAGATVYVSARSRPGAPDPEGLPGTVDDAAAMVTEAGGRGLAIACDHTDETAVSGLAARILEEHGRLDLLVNAVWGGYEHYDPEDFARAPWEQPVARWDKMLGTGVRAAYLTVRACLPLLLEGRRPLVLLVSAGDRGRFLGDIQYDVAKAAVDRLGFALARKLRGRLTALTLHPGFTYTERVEQHAGGVRLPRTHSARYVGRAVLALVNDPDVATRTGTTPRVAELGQAYGFTDVDGTRPEPYEIPDDL